MGMQPSRRPRIDNTPLGEKRAGSAHPLTGMIPHAPSQGYPEAVPVSALDTLLAWPYEQEL